jgi:hypothetical protein
MEPLSQSGDKKGGLIEFCLEMQKLSHAYIARAARRYYTSPIVPIHNNQSPHCKFVTAMSTVKTEFDPKNMRFRRLGATGLRVPVFSLGGCERFV